MRKLPVYLLLDTSGSMKGEPIQAMCNGVQTLISSLRQDPYALESVHVSVITFDRTAQLLVPLTPLDEFILPEITTPDSGPTHLGEALNMLISRIEQEFIPHTQEQKGDWRPLLFVLTDGSPSDLQIYKQACQQIHNLKLGGVVACAAGPKAKTEPLKELTPFVYKLDMMDSHSFQQFFKWVSASVASEQRSIGVGQDSQHDLPPPPEEIQVVV